MRLAIAVWCVPAYAACLIQGTVVDSVTGAPVAGARIYAKLRANAPRPSILRVTGDRGAFCFERLEAGDHYLAVERYGYLAIIDGAKPGSYEGMIAHPVGGDTELAPVTLRLVPAAAISGRVVDADGEAIEGATVQLSRKVWDHGWQPSRNALRRSDDRGMFRFTDLRPGTYYVNVEARDEPRTGLLDEKGQRIATVEAPAFYQSSTTFESATPIRLAAGQNAANLHLTAARVAARRLSGRLTGSRLDVVVRPLQGGSFVRAKVDEQGRFVVENLLPGRYEVRRDVVRAEVDLTLGDVEGILLEAAPTADLRIRVRVEGAGSAPPLVGVASISGTYQRNMRPDANGVCVHSGVPQGRYRILTNDEAYFVKAIKVEGAATAGKEVEVRGNVSAEVVLSTNTARVEGVVDGELPAAGATVVVVAEAESTVEVEGYRREVDRTGKFAREKLAPGKYRAFAIAGFERELWGSPELAAALRGKSVAFELREGESRAIGVPLTTEAEWLAALAKIGL